MAHGMCSVPTCTHPAYCRTWCRTHYNRWDRTGDVQAHIPIRPKSPPYAQGETCSVPTCDDPPKARGMCKAHRLRVLDTGDARPTERIRRAGRICSIPTCVEPSRTRTWCQGHYQRFRLTGDVQADVPLRPYLVEVEAHFWSKVNKNGPLPEHRPDLGGCWLWTDAPNNSGYGTFAGGRKREGAHRFSLRLAGIEIPDGHEPDHLCRVRLCVRPDHLDPVTHRENVRRSNATKATCINGHPRTGPGRCRLCAAEAQQAIRAKLTPSQDGRTERLTITAELLAEVADVYRTAVATGRPPLFAVALHFDRSYSAASRLARRARESGALGAADSGRGYYPQRQGGSVHAGQDDREEA